MYYTPLLRIISFIIVPIFASLNNVIIDEKLNGLEQTNTQLFEGKTNTYVNNMINKEFKIIFSAN